MLYFHSLDDIPDEEKNKLEIMELANRLDRFRPQEPVGITGIIGITGNVGFALQNAPMEPSQFAMMTFRDGILVGLEVFGE